MYIRFITVLSMILAMAVSSTAAFAEPIDPQPEDPLALVSCADACGGMAESGCWCDPGCTDFGDCCPDYHSTCELPEVESSCADACGGPGAGDCWCDDACADYGDCCADYLDTCDPIQALPTCVDACGGQRAAGCWCDEFCADFGDCCDDHDAACTPVSSDVDAHLVPLSEPVAGIPFDLVLSVSSQSGAHASAGVTLSLDGIDRADLIEGATERVSADGQTRVLRLQQVVLDEGAHTARFEVDGEAFERDLHVGSASPPIYVARVFSELIEEQMIPLTEPAPGAVVSVVVNGVTAGADAALWVELADGPVVEAAMVLDLEAWFVPAEVSSNLAVVAFTLPEFLPEGLMKLRVHIDDQHSRWVPLEVSNQGATRTELGDLLAEQLAEPLTGLVVTAPYRSLPSGALLENGLTGEPVHTIQHDGTWLFFAFDPTSGFEQDTALWILVDPEGAIETIEGQGAWPDVLVDGQATFADVGASLMLQSASSWVGPWARKDPPSQVTNTYPDVPLITRIGDGKAFSGRVDGTCPNGIRKIGLILQLDDRNGFDWLSDEMERL